MISGTVSVNNYHYHQLVKDADVQLLTSTHANKIAELRKEGLYLVFSRSLAETFSFLHKLVSTLSRQATLSTKYFHNYTNQLIIAKITRVEVLTKTVKLEI